MGKFFTGAVIGGIACYIAHRKAMRILNNMAKPYVPPAATKPEAK